MSESTKRRRIIEEEDTDDDDDNGMEPEMEEEDDDGDAPNNNNSNNNNDDDDDDAMDQDPAAAEEEEETQEQKQRRKRRERKLLAELRDLQSTTFPSDANYDINTDFQTTAIDNDDQFDADNDYDDELDDDADYNDDGDENVNNLNLLRGPQREEEEGEGEDLMENLMTDYQPIQALDTYGKEDIDNQEYANMNMDQRKEAERIIREREEIEGRGQGRDLFGGRSGRFYEGLYEAEEDEEERRRRRGRILRRGEDEEGMDVDQEQEEEEDDEAFLEQQEEVNLEAFDVPLKEWIAQERTRREVARKFRRFIMNFTEDEQDDSNSNTTKKRRRKVTVIYEDRIRTMCSANLATLEISYLHLMQAEPILAMWIVDAPRDMLDVLNEAATRHTLMRFPSYTSIQDEIHVRIMEYPVMDSLRALRRNNLDHLVKVNGVVTRRSHVYPQLKLAYYDCARCKAVLGPFRVEESAITGAGGGDKQSESVHHPSSCHACESEGPFFLNSSRSQYRNYQRVNLQETPGSVPPGRVPRTKEVLLTNDLIDIARPGQEIDTTGIFSHSFDYSLTQKSGFPVFSTYIIANHVRRKEDVTSSDNLTEKDKAEILELSKDPNIAQRIVDSIAPSIYGHRHVKMALAMSLFGAVPKNVSNKHRIRGDVNILLLGDPGTAKSQMLKYAEATAPRAVYSTGKGASAVGLTASVHKDPITREWTLEGGALVLADRGVCLIDEFDKMNEQDRTSIHEAMEQQTISISKAGIVTQLQARCSVIAAANPIGGRYDSSCTFSENVELTDPILQRFDLLCVLQDTVDPVADERLSKFVTGSHMRSVATNFGQPTGTVQPLSEDVELYSGMSGTTPKDKIIPQSLLRKYIQYARTNIKPVLRGSTFDQEKVASLYVALRRESASSGGVPIAVRHIESIMRLAEAHSKMHLREYVRDDDMDASIGMMLESFITAQKFSVRRQLQRSFSKYISTGADKDHLLLHILQDMMRNEAMYQTIRLRQRGQSAERLGIIEVPFEEFKGRARDRRIYDVAEFCNGDSLTRAGYAFDAERGVFTREHE